MSLPLFPHSLTWHNFAPTQDMEAEPTHETPHERRTLDGWLDQFFGARDDDYEILFGRLVRAVAFESGCEINDHIVQNITSDDLDEITQLFSSKTLCSIWRTAIIMIDSLELTT